MKSLAVLLLFLITPPASALAFSGQSLRHLNPNRFNGTAVGVSSGDELEVVFTSPGLAGRKISVLVKHPNGKQTVEFEIQPDCTGRGTKKWRVPSSWPGAVLTEPTSADHGVIVVP